MNKVSSNNKNNNNVINKNEITPLTLEQTGSVGGGDAFSDQAAAQQQQNLASANQNLQLTLQKNPL